MTGPAGGVPWKGLGMLIVIFTVCIAAFRQSPTAPVVSVPAAVTVQAVQSAQVVPVAPVMVPGAFTDAYGRIEWARIAAMGGVFGGVASVVLMLMAPHLVNRERAIRMADMDRWSTDVWKGIEHDTDRARSVMGKIMGPEAIMIRGIPRLEGQVTDVAYNVGELTDEIRKGFREFTKQREKDREQFLLMRGEVDGMAQATGYVGPNRRHGERRHGDEEPTT